MKISQKGINLIKKYEGLRLEAYKPVSTEKYWTIGYGHYGSDVTKGMKITEAKADELLRKDLEKFENYVNKYVKVQLTQEMFDSLVSFSFNVGGGNLQSSTLLKKLNVGNYMGAAEEFAKWTKAGGKTLQGLVRRRADEKVLYLSGGIPNGTTLPPNHTQTKFIAGEIYTTTTNLYIRETPNGNKKDFSQLTANAKKNSLKDSNHKAILRKGTRVTCQEETKLNNGSIWIKIPSGYICGINADGSVYVK